MARQRQTAPSSLAPASPKAQQTAYCAALCIENPADRDAVCALLVKAGANPAETRGDKIPLKSAIASGMPSAVAKAVADGADPNAPFEDSDPLREDGLNPPLVNAALRQKPEAFDALLKAGADPFCLAGAYGPNLWRAPAGAASIGAWICTFSPKCLDKLLEHWKSSPAPDPRAAAEAQYALSWCRENYQDRYAYRSVSSDAQTEALSRYGADFAAPLYMSEIDRLEEIRRLSDFGREPKAGDNPEKLKQAAERILFLRTLPVRTPSYFESMDKDLANGETSMALPLLNAANPQLDARWFHAPAGQEPAIFDVFSRLMDRYAAEDGELQKKSPKAHAAGGDHEQIFFKLALDRASAIDPKLLQSLSEFLAFRALQITRNTPNKALFLPLLMDLTKRKDLPKDLRTALSDVICPYFGKKISSGWEDGHYAVAVRYKGDDPETAFTQLAEKFVLAMASRKKEPLRNSAPVKRI